MNRKRCFVISPLGDAGSVTRVRSDQILAHVIRPVVQSLGFDVVRADEIAEPGIISTQVLERVAGDHLVIADLTERNPNVYYELAVRHAVRKPVIQLLQKGELLPFDIAGTRTIVVDHKDLDSVADAKKQLAQYILNIENLGQVEFDSPISLAVDLQAMRGSGDPQRAGLAEITERVTSVHGTVVSIQSAVESGLVLKLDRLLRVVHELQKHSTSHTDEGTASELGGRVENLRAKLVGAVDQIVGDIQMQYVQLAVRIQDVFAEQSATAAQSVRSSFADALERAMPVSVEREILLRGLLEIFMHGMASMGAFQRINVTKHTEACATEIRDKIKRSIQEIFGEIDELEKKVLALP
jgi:hypothetical protein